jgi:hypothetical protein
MRTAINKKWTRGFSLVELMLGLLTLGFIMLTSAIAVRSISTSNGASDRQFKVNAEIRRVSDQLQTRAVQNWDTLPLTETDETDYQNNSSIRITSLIGAPNQISGMRLVTITAKYLDRGQDVTKHHRFSLSRLRDMPVGATVKVKVVSENDPTAGVQGVLVQCPSQSNLMASALTSSAGEAILLGVKPLPQGIDCQADGSSMRAFFTITPGQFAFTKTFHLATVQNNAVNDDLFENPITINLPGMISGDVIDVIENVKVPNVPIALVPLAYEGGLELTPTIEELKTVSDAGGRYVFPRLIPGKYHVINLGTPLLCAVDRDVVDVANPLTYLVVAANTPPVEHDFKTAKKGSVTGAVKLLSPTDPSGDTLKVSGTPPIGTKLGAAVYNWTTSYSDGWVVWYGGGNPAVSGTSTNPSDWSRYYTWQGAVGADSSYTIHHLGPRVVHPDRDARDAFQNVMLFVWPTDVPAGASPVRAIPRTNSAPPYSREDLYFFLNVEANVPGWVPVSDADMIEYGQSVFTGDLEAPQNNNQTIYILAPEALAGAKGQIISSDGISAFHSPGTITTGTKVTRTGSTLSVLSGEAATVSEINPATGNNEFTFAEPALDRNMLPNPNHFDRLPNPMLVKGGIIGNIGTPFTFTRSIGTQSPTSNFTGSTIGRIKTAPGVYSSLSSMDMDEITVRFAATLTIGGPVVWEADVPLVNGQFDFPHLVTREDLWFGEKRVTLPLTTASGKATLCRSLQFTRDPIQPPFIAASPLRSEKSAGQAGFGERSVASHRWSISGQLASL